MTERYDMYILAYQQTSHYILIMFGASAMLAGAIFSAQWLPEKVQRLVRTGLDIFCLFGFVAVMIYAYAVPPTN